MPSDPEKSFFDRILNLFFYFSGIIIAFLVISVCYNVFMRYFLKSPPLWVVQGTEYSLLWIVFLSTSYVLREKGHVSIDILYSKIGGRKKLIIDILIYTLCSFFMAVLTIFSFKYFVECLFTRVKDVRTYTVPKWLVFSIVPFGSFFLTLQFLRLFVGEIKKLWNGTKH
jgi:TRAP-type C4-dicarboxylate transport system permease small subunit